MPWVRDLDLSKYLKDEERWMICQAVGTASAKALRWIKHNVLKRITRSPE